MFAKSDAQLIQDLLREVRQQLEFYAETQMPMSATESKRRQLLADALVSAAEWIRSTKW